MNLKSDFIQVHLKGIFSLDIGRFSSSKTSYFYFSMSSPIFGSLLYKGNIEVNLKGLPPSLNYCNEESIILEQSSRSFFLYSVSFSN